MSENDLKGLLLIEKDLREEILVKEEIVYEKAKFAKKTGLKSN